MQRSVTLEVMFNGDIGQYGLNRILLWTGVTLDFFDSSGTLLVFNDMLNKQQRLCEISVAHSNTRVGMYHPDRTTELNWREVANL